MNRTEQLAEKLKELAFAHKDEIEALSTTDKWGGEGAASIPGWMHLGNATISKACKLGGVPIMLGKYSSHEYPL